MNVEEAIKLKELQLKIQNLCSPSQQIHAVGQIGVFAGPVLAPRALCLTVRV